MYLLSRSISFLRRSISFLRRSIKNERDECLVVRNLLAEIVLYFRILLKSRTCSADWSPYFTQESVLSHAQSTVFAAVAVIKEEPRYLIASFIPGLVRATTKKTSDQRFLYVLVLQLLCTGYGFKEDSEGTEGPAEGFSCFLQRWSCW
ncbi:uncharacterized protein LOC131303403 [Rhododendron vialii]|uniref:uncharacterized protein LOC131303403 n=1 Tax=Rhododendron vialii TaxID=182163 RepID=UPI00265EDB9E|nr:uncharacterized protein LOC131303403 [Rhododendron vialii]